MPRSRMRRISATSCLALLVGQAAGDLVQKQELGVGGERARQFQPLAVEQRQRAGRAVGFVATVRSRAGSASTGVAGASRTARRRTMRRRAGSRRSSSRHRGAGSGRCARSPSGSGGRAARRRAHARRRRSSPPSILRSPLIRLNSVVLPAPFGPRMPRTSPGRTSKLTSCSTRTAPKDLLSPRASSSTSLSIGPSVGPQPTRASASSSVPARTAC